MRSVELVGNDPKPYVVALVYRDLPPSSLRPLEYGKARVMYEEARIKGVTMAPLQAMGMTSPNDLVAATLLSPEGVIIASWPARPGVPVEAPAQDPTAPRAPGETRSTWLWVGGVTLAAAVGVGALLWARRAKGARGSRRSGRGSRRSRRGSSRS